MQITRTSFTLAALVGMSAAIKAMDDGTIHDHSIDTHYQSQAQCDALTDSWKYHYEFDADACRCLFVFDIPYDPGCEADAPHFNPLHVPGHLGETCLT